ncbi:uncharacterized protein EDB91DRAFT_1162223 [Suillus paluster]|uniref:uncharacterized protein n=1 Tax=Suillus paluster TaxID=48578 RepID=UPI001B86D9C5|nr:uncharacterized protein EDB91DRAFT_1162223 [Suillus paluster]KAG1728401.1 hypothetical protein EDB91DRAFT_1162223 [Suillus paluster]
MTSSANEHCSTNGAWVSLSFLVAFFVRVLILLSPVMERIARYVQYDVKGYCWVVLTIYQKYGMRFCQFWRKSNQFRLSRCPKMLCNTALSRGVLLVLLQVSWKIPG